MIEFSSALSAVTAAQALLVAVGEEDLPAVRIGLHLGDVVLATNDDLLGHGVNVAARLMALASPGTAVLSAPVQIQLNEATRSTLRPLGRVQLDKWARASTPLQSHGMTPHRFSIGGTRPRAARCSLSCASNGRPCARSPSSGRSCNAKAW